MKTLVAVVDDELFMFADEKEPKETDKCIVYDARRKQYAPPLCIGSWTARIPEWRLPTKEQKEKAKEFVPNE